MAISDYLESLTYHDDALFLGAYRAFWTQVILDYMERIGPETDADLENLKNTLLEAYRKGQPLAQTAAHLGQEIIRLRGVGFWRDDTVLGRKYRILWAMAPNGITTPDGEANWVYGIDTAFDLIELDRPLDNPCVRDIEARFNAFRAAQEQEPSARNDHKIGTAGAR